MSRSCWTLFLSPNPNIERRWQTGTILGPALHKGVEPAHCPASLRVDEYICRCTRPPRMSVRIGQRINDRNCRTQLADLAHRMCTVIDHRKVDLDDALLGYPEASWLDRLSQDQSHLLLQLQISETVLKLALQLRSSPGQAVGTRRTEFDL